MVHFAISLSPLKKGEAVDPLLEPFLKPIEEPDWEETASLSISDLKGRYPNFDPRSLKADLTRAFATYAQQSSSYNEVDLESRELVLDTEAASAKGWKGIYFVCPLTGQRTKVLYFVEGLLISRTAYHSPAIRAKLQRQAHRRCLIRELRTGKRRLSCAVIEAMVEELDRVRNEDDPAAQQAIDAAATVVQRRVARRKTLQGREERRTLRRRRQKREARDRKAVREADRMGIWAALRRAEAHGGAQARQCTRGLSLELLASVTEVRLADFDVLQAPPEPLADHLHIDIRLLRQEAAYWRSGELTIFALTEAILVGIDLRSNIAPEIRFGFAVEGISHLQRVALVMEAIGGRVRPLFECPSGALVEMLSFRGGRFASVGVQRLLRPSEVARRAKPKACLGASRSAESLPALGLDL